MGKTTEIAWTDMTFNPWIGCTRISPGCAHCYAETQNKHYQWNPAGWGKGAPRKRTSPANWKKPIAWAKQAVDAGITRRVFCASLADVFDSEVAPEWRADLYDLINQTGKIGGLEWLLLTKRPDNLPSMLPATWQAEPPAYVRIGTTVENQKYGDLRIPLLLNSWKGKNFLSMEPLLGPVDLTALRDAYWFDPTDPTYYDALKGDSYFSDGDPGLRGGPVIDWVICGGESGPGARPMHPNWARRLRDQCQVAGVPFMFKQWGEWSPTQAIPTPGQYTGGGVFLKPDGFLGNQGDYWHGNADGMDKVGKKRAGNLLDGQSHLQFPTP